MAGVSREGGGQKEQRSGEVSGRVQTPTGVGRELVGVDLLAPLALQPACGREVEERRQLIFVPGLETKEHHLMLEGIKRGGEVPNRWN